MELIQIGIIHSPFKQSSGTPIQPVFGKDSTGQVEVFPEYIDGLTDLDGFERIWLIFGANRARPARLKQIPYRDTVERGVFAIRSPSRPNPICISPVKLIGIKGGMLDITEVDILDGSPLFDIKAYIPAYDAFPDAVAGWFDRGKGKGRGDVESADERFESGE